MFKNRAFTLIELLVVVAIIGILASVVVASVNSAREKARIGGARHFEAQVEHVAGELLVGKWDFDECPGAGVATTAMDLSGFGKNGTPMASPQWSVNTPTAKGCSIAFNGTSQYITLPKIDSTITTAVTISAWIYPTNAPGGYQGITGNSAGNMMSFVQSGQIVFDINTNNGRVILLRGNVVNNLWQYITLVYDGSAMNWYIDGKLVGTAAQTGTITQTAGGYIGYSGYSTEFFSGSIDSVRIFAKALTASEVNTLYVEGLQTHTLAEK